MKEFVNIENPRKYAAHEVDDLRDLLRTGGQAEQDPRREHFYNIESNKHAYYFHISPVSGNVVLLAKWSRRPSECYIEDEQMVAS
jgi:hypothetical protein